MRGVKSEGINAEAAYWAKWILGMFGFQDRPGRASPRVGRGRERNGNKPVLNWVGESILGRIWKERIWAAENEIWSFENLTQWIWNQTKKRLNSNQAFGIFSKMELWNLVPRFKLQTIALNQRDLRIKGEVLKLEIKV
jgi:hypothetical protein